MIGCFFFFFYKPKKVFFFKTYPGAVILEVFTSQCIRVCVCFKAVEIMGSPLIGKCYRLFQCSEIDTTPSTKEVTGPYLCVYCILPSLGLQESNKRYHYLTYSLMIAVLICTAKLTYALWENGECQSYCVSSSGRQNILMICSL